VGKKMNFSPRYSANCLKYLPYGLLFHKLAINNSKSQEDPASIAQTMDLSTAYNPETCPDVSDPDCPSQSIFITGTFLPLPDHLMLSGKWQNDGRRELPANPHHEASIPRS
jgi:hypothetical protein